MPVTSWSEQSLTEGSEARDLTNTAPKVRQEESTRQFIDRFFRKTEHIKI